MLELCSPTIAGDVRQFRATVSRLLTSPSPPCCTIPCSSLDRDLLEQLQAFSSPSHCRSTACISCPTRTGTGRFDRRWKHCASARVANGQQTTRTLHDADGRESTAAVLVKAIMVPRDPKAGSEKFDMLVSRIVAATNWQNAIRASDLMANDRRQIEIERELRKFNYYYLRKRQSKSEARRFIGAHQRVVTKEEIAQAVAGCELDPAIVREGKEGLFEEHLYPKVFPTSDPCFYLNRFRLKYEVRWRSKGYPERAYATWLVLQVMWSQVAPIIRSRAVADAFREASERNTHPIDYLSEAINSMFRAALAFYRQQKGKGETAIDVSTFFQRKGLAPEFETFLRGKGRAFSKTVRKRLDRFEAELREVAA